MTEWIETVYPTEPGFYWFYGRPWPGFRGEPRRFVVEVRRVGSSIVYISSGTALDRAEGRWTKIEEAT